jgi:putative peptidoglycan lipid II flippase
MNRRFVFHVTSTLAISVALQFVGLARHVLIAAFFGVSRDMDGYLVLYGLATLVVFNLSNVFDSVAVSRLVQIQDGEGTEAFWKSSTKLTIQSLFAGLCLAVIFLLSLRLAMPVVAAGFSNAERAHLVSLANYFLPWILIVIPYYALASHLKALWQFHWVFGSELVTVTVSIAALWFFHDSIADLPLAYFAGYIAAAIVLLAARGFRRVKAETAPGRIVGNMASQHLANQIGTISGLADRYYQSFLTAGGISALGYAGQIVNNLSSLMTFREIYIVPLSSEVGRSEKVERVLKGVVLISVPAAAFIFSFAEIITSVLFQRGNFNAEAVSLTSNVLGILALSLVSSTILAPLQRVFQITNRVIFTHAFYASSLLGVLILQYLFVFILKWDVRGFTIASIANSVFVTVVVASLVRRCGVLIVWRRVFAYAAYATVLAVCASLVALLGSSSYFGLAKLLIAAPIFGSIVVAGYLVIHRRIRTIVGMP